MMDSQNMPEKAQQSNKDDRSLSIEKFKQELKEENVIEDNIYTMNKRCFKWASSLKKELAHKEDKKGIIKKVENDELIIMFCTNATGKHKFSYFIYVYQNEESVSDFKSKKDKHLNDQSVNFMSMPEKKMSWNSLEMENIIIEDWYNNCFTKTIGEYQRKVVLLLKDNIILRINSNLLNRTQSDLIMIKYFPYKTSGDLQPIKKSIIENIMNYCCRKASEDSFDIGYYVKTISERWKKYKTEKITKLWKKLFTSDSTTEKNAPSTSSVNQPSVKNVREEDTDFEKSSGVSPSKKFKRENNEEPQESGENSGNTREIEENTETPCDESEIDIKEEPPCDEFDIDIKKETPCDDSTNHKSVYIKEEMASTDFENEVSLTSSVNQVLVKNVREEDAEFEKLSEVSSRKKFKKEINEEQQESGENSGNTREKEENTETPCDDSTKFVYIEVEMASTNFENEVSDAVNENIETDPLWNESHNESENSDKWE